MNTRKIFKGFSLFEVIVSIIVLSIISGFILQMFIVSSELNQKAKDLDFLSLKAISAIELLKSADFIEEGIIREYYDKDNMKFLLEIKISNSAKGLDGNMYDIEAYVFVLSGENEKDELISFNTKKYFTGDKS